MSDFAKKLLSIEEKEKKLKEEKLKLETKRKQEIGQRAEQFKLLTAKDEFILGLFHEAKEALEKDAVKRKHWEAVGAKLLNKKQDAVTT